MIEEKGVYRNEEVEDLRRWVKDSSGDFKLIRGGVDESKPNGCIFGDICLTCGDVFHGRVRVGETVFTGKIEKETEKALFCVGTLFVVTASSSTTPEKVGTWIPKKGVEIEFDENNVPRTYKNKKWCKNFTFRNVR